ncbi:hypothetical protein HU200_024104 [Digitaria exilis]|uniref:Uncharacterized protein n=1 Tax=Digitaria exilis TaxID=1010633 RepID=A0A835CB76_9POAL|nr:hypothetical protein HU200_024104 [Digitaria exilis]
MDSLVLVSRLLTTTANDDNPVASCPSDTNYTHGSAFQANLDILLSSLPATTAGASTGFATNTTGSSCSAAPTSSTHQKNKYNSYGVTL